MTSRLFSDVTIIYSESDVAASSGVNAGLIGRNVELCDRAARLYIHGHCTNVIIRLIIASRLTIYTAMYSPNNELVFSSVCLIWRIIVS